ncbi:MAG: PIN domain-containing protein [Planctomycetota bacterium]
MKKLKLYVETSVWSHLLAEDAPESRAATEAFFREIGQYEIYISQLVKIEIGNTRDARKREALSQLVQQYGPVEIELTDEAAALARRYLDEGVVARSAKDDALHVATATVEELDVIVSLNMRHIVSLKTRRGINAVNALAGYRPIEIATPQEVAIHGED